MDPTPLMTQTATISTPVPSGVDEYNDVTTTPTTATVACWLHQTARDENTVNQNLQGQTWQVYFPPGTSVDGSATITVDDLDYELVGPPWPAFNPRLRRVTHIEATVRRVA